jgi:hypothetical protein
LIVPFVAYRLRLGHDVIPAVSILSIQDFVSDPVVVVDEPREVTLNHLLSDVFDVILMHDRHAADLFGKILPNTIGSKIVNE